MSATAEGIVRDLAPAQAIELALLVETEARWENLRKALSRAQEVRVATDSLLTAQKAYEAFRGRLVAYNKRYTPAHVPELLLNTPARLAAWCRQMRALYLCVEHDPQARCPVQLLEKAYRRAERLSIRLNKDGVCRSAPPVTIRAAVDDLEALAQWCEALAGVKAVA